WAQLGNLLSAYRRPDRRAGVRSVRERRGDRDLARGAPQTPLRRRRDVLVDARRVRALLRQIRAVCAPGDALRAADRAVLDDVVGALLGALAPTHDARGLGR